MRILIAEDDLTSRTILAGVLKESGHEVIATVNGADAWDALQQPDAPRLVILDWIMPKLDGLEVLRRIRARQTDQPPYIIMLTVRGGKADIIAGLDAGANDYLSKPFDAGELRARINVGRRMIEMQSNLVEARQIINESFKTAGMIHILFVDDEQDTLSAIERLLRKEMFALHFVTNGADALALMAKRPIHIIVTDMKMSGMDGLSLLRHVKSLYPDTVRMALSSYLQIGQLLPCINTGEIYQYITKPANEDMKPVIHEAVKYFMAQNQRISLVRDVQEKNEKLRLMLEQEKKVEKQLQDIPVVSDITEPNDRPIPPNFQTKQFEQSNCDGNDLSCLTIDLNHFKQIKDTHGHNFADFVLKEFSARLKKAIRSTDIVFRYDGERFLVLLPDTTLQKAQILGDKIALGKIKPFVHDGRSATVTVGVFAASFKRSQPQTAENLILLADKMLAGLNKILL
jgi:diguanylate cyclase (GGDEF)-like protein